ncbi:MAG: phosphoribosylanthranilate isomerase [Xanthomonadales bacterium]|jgi:phosphoribosylanthranilate isomerase|nr:phosphoribosylanthranilate isomerase [Xanthomonadales bacterium]
MKRTRIKFCGITRPEDALLAADLGVDALGFVFVPGSRRNIQPEVAADIAAALPPFVSTVALFMDAAPADIRAVLESFRPTLLQFHGIEAPEDCTPWGLPYLKAVPMGGAVALTPELASQRLADFTTRYYTATALLLDGHPPGAAGGSGERLDWDSLTPGAQRLVLAGGLTPERVGEAMLSLQPWAVDVSSGIEDAPGRKSAQKMRDFVAAVRRTDLVLAERVHGST